MNNCELLVNTKKCHGFCKKSKDWAKADAKAKKIKEQSEEIKKISGKHQRKFLLSLGVGRP